MDHRKRVLAYLLILVALAVLPVAIPSAWARPAQMTAAQTVPTRTSAPPPAPTSPPSSDSGGSGGSGESPTAVPTVLPDTPVPPATETTTAQPIAAAKLSLKKQVAPNVAWPGATLHYTLTLSNPGTAAAGQIVILDPLPAELAPGTLPEGADARWEDQVLRVQAATLAPNARLVIAFTAEVRADAPPGSIITNQASATASGNLRASASAPIALPPAELPPTGGSLNGLPDLASTWR
jgi:uncharacterized repeat protein (TIGR01451 family)